MTRVAEPIRILTAVPICDGHDSAISTVNLELIRAGVEVIYLGYNRSVRDIVRAAIQEDVRGIGISSYNGGHVEFFSDIVKQLKREGADDIRVFGGGGGTITNADVAILHRRGVDRIFMAGTALSEIVEYVKHQFAKAPVRRAPKKDSDRSISEKISPSSGTPGEGRGGGANARARGRTPTLALPRSTVGGDMIVIGVTGPGGAGKTTLIDELVLRFLNQRKDSRIAILSHDPSIVAGGALLGDRATMIYSQDDRVFMRSLATRGQAGGLSAETKYALRALKALPFDVIIIETVGTGQEAMPFRDGLVDRSIFVMSPEYGSQLQLQKIAMLDLADIIVVNKSDLPGGARASSEVEQRINANSRGQRVLATVAKCHGDRGVDQLFSELTSSPGTPGEGRGEGSGSKG